MTKLLAIFHIDESSKWSLTLANVNSLLNDLGKNEVSIVVLANSFAVRDYVPLIENNHILEKVKDLAVKGVLFKACRNSLMNNNIDETTLPKHIEIVPSGVSELVKRQAEGYGYIRP